MLTQPDVLEALRWSSILNGSICLMIAVFAALGVAGGIYITLRGVKETPASIRSWLTSVGVISCFVFLILFCVFFWLGLTGVVNPDMSVVDYVVRHRVPIETPRFSF